MYLVEHLNKEKVVTASKGNKQTAKKQPSAF
jgi:hypothetical protein